MFWVKEDLAIWCLMNTWLHYQHLDDMGVY